MNILFLPTSGWWPFARGPLGLTMWPLAASGGWPLARGQLHSDLVNARRMRPYMPGGRWRGGPYKRGTTVYEPCRIKTQTIKNALFVGILLILYSYLHSIFMVYFGECINK